VTGPLRVEVARTLEELEMLRPAWDEVGWHREEAAYPYFTTRLATRPDVIGPYAAVVFDDEQPVGGLAGRLELRKLDTKLGYRTVYAPTVRYLQIVDGGLVAVSPGVLAALRDSVAGALASGEATAFGTPPLEVGSPELAALESLGGVLERQPLIAPWTRRLLRLPAAFDEFLSSRSHKTRKGIRQNARRLETAFGGRLSVEVIRGPDQADELVDRLDAAARTTYQRGLGAGFSATDEQRALARVGLEHGWLAGYVLLLEGAPAAYWFCSRYGGRLLLRTGGFDNAYAEHRPGIYLLMRVIEDACADPEVGVLDYGPGDATYKEQFSNESREERNAVVFASTFRGRRINAARTAVLAPARAARSALDATQLTSRVRAHLRRSRR
jgi:hypothetical protein